MRAKAPLSASLEKARQRFEHWRKNRKGRRIPVPLWELAVKLAGEHGCHRTARVLRLNSDSLKARMRSSTPRGSQKRDDRASFVEVLPGGLTPGLEYLMELEDSSGAKLRIHVKGGGEIPDLIALTTGFWKGEA